MLLSDRVLGRPAPTTPTEGNCSRQSSGLMPWSAPERPTARNRNQLAGRTGAIEPSHPTCSRGSVRSSLRAQCALGGAPAGGVRCPTSPTPFRGHVVHETVETVHEPHSEGPANVSTDAGLGIPRLSFLFGNHAYPCSVATHSKRLTSCRRTSRRSPSRMSCGSGGLGGLVSRTALIL